jgi:hypothetical protein
MDLPANHNAAFFSSPGLLLLLLCCLSGPGAAQEGRANVPYQIPQTVFVGDLGRLVLPLGTAAAGALSVVLEKAEELPSLRDLVISRIELESRGGNARLIVDFRAYVPGQIALPPIEIASFIFTDLEVTVASILEAEGNSLVLSGPAEPLAVPGTMGMIYGTILGIVLVILGALLMVFRGRPAFRRWREEFRRRQVIRSMGRILKQLRNALEKDGFGKTAQVLDRLSTEFKAFLSFFTGMNCQAMTGGDFLFLPSLTPEPSGPFLRDFFRSCDALRFSGEQIDRLKAIELLDQVRDFIGELEKSAEEPGGAGSTGGSGGGAAGGEGADPHEAAGGGRADSRETGRAV